MQSFAIGTPTVGRETHEASAAGRMATSAVANAGFHPAMRRMSRSMKFGDCMSPSSVRT